MLWQTLLVLLGNAQVKEALDADERSSFRGDTWGGAQYMEWHALRKLINVNPPQFDKASVLYLMEQHIPGRWILIASRARFPLYLYTYRG